MRNDAGKIGPHPVHFIDKRNPRNAVLVGLPPHRFRLRLDTADSAENTDRTVENPQRTLHLGGKIDVTRGVDNINLMIFPVAGGGCRGDRNAPFLFLFHPVHGRLTVVHFSDFVAFSRVVENSFRCGCFARIDMGDNSDISQFGQIHVFLPTLHSTIKEGFCRDWEFPIFQFLFFFSGNFSAFAVQSDKGFSR